MGSLFPDKSEQKIKNDPKFDIRRLCCQPFNCKDNFLIIPGSQRVKGTFCEKGDGDHLTV